MIANRALVVCFASPHFVGTMDDLLWSIEPKVVAEDRKRTCAENVGSLALPLVAGEERQPVCVVPVQVAEQDRPVERA